MANLKLLIDTDIIIDCLKGIRAARELFRTQNIEVYCSVLSKKELFFQTGADFFGAEKDSGVTVEDENSED